MLRLGKWMVMFGILLSIQALAQQQGIVYKESMEDFPNPERGFYQAISTGSSPFKGLDPKVLEGFRKFPQTAKRASYSVYSTLVLREYNLDSFVTKPIAENFLASLYDDFAAARAAGVKLIVRFAYVYKSHGGNCPDEYKICPPYGDASKPTVLKHISQLKKVLRDNADVMAVLQLGFIGVWGENYFTDYFGDASMNGPGVIKDSSWRDRNEVLKAMLDVLPKSRMVQVRTPQIKQKFVGGAKAQVESPGLNESVAFNGSDVARIGFHNDCILASEDDYGTFYDYGNSSGARKPANKVLRDYFINESKWVPIGGETCDDAYSPQNDCPPAGRAEEEFRKMHYSYLNTSYNVDVNNDWVEGGCMDRIKKSLGYRFVLRGAELPRRANAGSAVNIKLVIENVGYASPFNPRPLVLILRGVGVEKDIKIELPMEIRKWYPGKTNAEVVVKLPAGIKAGRYEMLLNLPDAAPVLSGNPAYSIRLANEGLWEASTGYNKLNAEIEIAK